MIYYIFIVIFPFFSFVKNKNIKIYALMLSFLFLVSFCSLRWQTGTDWLPYYDDFMSPGNRHDFEIGYVLYVKLIRYLTDNYTLFLFTTSIIPIALIFWGCLKTQKNISLTILSVCVFYSYYYLGSFFGAERRIIAIGLSFFALIQYKSNKKVQSLILILCASTFHISSLVTLSVFLINKLSLNLYKILLVLGAILSLPLSHYLSDIISSVISLIPVEIVRYKLTVYTQNAQEYGSISISGILKRVVISAIFIYTLSFDIKNNKANLFLVKTYLFGTIIYLFLSPISAMFSVISIYFTIVEILLIPAVLVRVGIFTRIPALIFIVIFYFGY
ncbi:EpsG family protein, partial [Salmonella enterica]|nr:EpsG family protein [Salmonella enterica]